MSARSIQNLRKLSKIMSDCSQQDIHLEYCRGVIAIRGQKIQQIAKNYIADVPYSAVNSKLARDGRRGNEIEFHATIFIPSELQNLDVQAILDQSCAVDVHDIGLSVVKVNRIQAWYVVLYSPPLQALRSQFGLPEKDLHITLGFEHSDPNGHPHGNTLVKSICLWNKPEEGVRALRCMPPPTTTLTYANHISAEQIRILLEQCYLYAMQGLSVLPILNALAEWARHKESDKYTPILPSLPTLHSTATPIPTPHPTSYYINLLRDISQHAQRQQLFSLAEQISVELLRLGFLFGLRLYITIQLTRFHRMNIKELISLMPLKLNNLQGSKGGHMQIDERIREMNELLMAGNAFMHEEEKRVFYFNSCQACVIMPHLPRNFSWVKLPVPGRDGREVSAMRYNFLLAGSAMPSKPEHVLALYGVGIRHIITIHESPLLLAHPYEGCMLERHHVFCIDRQPLELKEMDRMTSLMHSILSPTSTSTSTPTVSPWGILVHCLGGVGRTNTLIISYLMKYTGEVTREEGEGKVGCANPLLLPLPAQEVIESVSAQRKTLLSHTQITFLKQVWWREIAEGRAKEGEDEGEGGEGKVLKSEGNADEGLEGQAEPQRGDNRFIVSLLRSLSFPPVILLGGLPGSGKSTLSRALLTTYPDHFVHINRDVMRGKGEVDRQFADFMQAHKRGGSKRVLLLDATHVTRAKRDEWIQAMSGLPIWCIFFDLPVEECIRRATARHSHPTLPAHSAKKVIESMAKQYEPVDSSKEKFSKMIIVHSEEEAIREIVQPWKVLNYPSPKIASQATASNSSVLRIPSDKPLKFPRTSHAVNLGAATRDDKVLPLLDLQTWIKTEELFVVEEKVDGANMGISIVEGQIRVQNRSHYISSQYHAQFELLDQWLAKHATELYEVLIPDKHILYGEWVYATHSVYYNGLEDWFIAYDLFDVEQQCFWSRDRLVQLLAPTSIKVVKVLYEGYFRSIEEITALVRGSSYYGDSPREGIVIRLMSKDEPARQTLRHRAKLVRSDFIAGNERWNKSNKLQKNQLAYY
ncbi:AAA family ATPase [archaeon]|nr:MAG: AAA family ATPase [archaeon]